MKFKNLIFALFIVIFYSCDKQRNCLEGEGAIVTQTISIDPFTGIDLIGAHNVVITQGAIQEVKATGHANIIAKLKTNVKNGIWESALKDGCYNNYELTIYVTVPTLSVARITGSGNIAVNNFYNQGDLLADIIGSGNINFNEFKDCQNFSVNILGSGNVSGTDYFDDLKNLNINIVGSGNYNGFQIKTENCSVNISGSGSCFVYVNNFLNVNISGSGSVFYKGYPVLNVNISGSGSVINSN